MYTAQFAASPVTGNRHIKNTVDDTNFEIDEYEMTASFTGLRFIVKSAFDNCECRVLKLEVINTVPCCVNLQNSLTLPS